MGQAEEVREGLGIGPETQVAATVMSCRTLARAPSPPRLLLPRGADILLPQPSFLYALSMACAPDSSSHLPAACRAARSG